MPTSTCVRDKKLCTISQHLPVINLLTLCIQVSRKLSNVCKSFSHRIGHSTVCRIVAETCNVIKKILQPKYLALPNKDQWILISENFNDEWQFSLCLGSIDGKHIRTRAPVNSWTMYYNCQHTFSLVRLVMCDGNYCFTFVDIGAYGSKATVVCYTTQVWGVLFDKEDWICLHQHVYRI